MFRLVHIVSAIAKPAFVEYANKFEVNAMDYYKRNGTIEGYSEGKMKELRVPGIRGDRFMKAAVGGTKQWTTQIQAISATSIIVKYTVADIFGAGREDADRTLIGWDTKYGRVVGTTFPGLGSMYWLQNNSAHFYPNEPGIKEKYTPFLWTSDIIRENHKR